MVEIPFSSFEELEQEVEKELSRIKNLMKTNPLKYYSLPLFRGQRKSSWKLKSTLERYIKSPEYPYLDYLQKMRNVQRDIQRETGKEFDLNQTFGGSNSNFQFIPYQGEYEFMAYLRHHGFPSPLLDWTSKIEVASFFAFQNPSDEENVAIYSYIEFIGEADFGWMAQANITVLGHDIYPDIRHKRQESSYTFSMKTVEEKKIFCYIEDGIENKMHIDKKLKKYLIPSGEREKVLKKLEVSGIDGHFLFPDEGEDTQNEDSLVEMLKRREFH